MGDIMLSLTLFREGDASRSQLAGTVFVKTKPEFSAGRVAAAFCFWAGLPSECCTLFDSNRRQLDPAASISAAGLGTSSPIIAFITQDAPPPNAQAAAAPFTIVDVLDTELAMATDGLGVAR